MKKLLVLVALFCAVVTAKTADFAMITLDGGYRNYYIVNGVSRAENTPYASFGALKSLKYFDVYAGGTLLPNDGLDESHWTVGFGKSLNFSEKFALRFTTDVNRHQSGVTGIPNSTEFGSRLSLENPYVTPYIRGSFDIDLEQYGGFVGIQRVQKLPWGFQIIPAFEYGRVSDYEVMSLKATLARPIGFVTPYAEVGWYDNSFYTTKVNFATRQLSDAVVYSAGVKFTF